MEKLLDFPYLEVNFIDIFQHQKKTLEIRVLFAKLLTEKVSNNWNV